MIEAYNDCIVPFIYEDDAEGNPTVPLVAFGDAAGDVMPDLCKPAEEADVVAICGNGEIEDGETCDENDVAGDGCSDTCIIEDQAACRAARFDDICGSAHIEGPTQVDTDVFKNWTFETWFQWSNDGEEDFQHLSLFRDGCPKQSDSKISLEVINRNGGEIRFREWDNANQIRVPLQNPNGWHHVAVTSDGAEFVMYIDGNEVGRQAAVLPNLRDSDFSIGGVYHRN